MVGQFGNAGKIPQGRNTIGKGELCLPDQKDQEAEKERKRGEGGKPKKVNPWPAKPKKGEDNTPEKGKNNNKKSR